MPRKKTMRNSNLFSIDFEGIESVLEDANGPLIAECEKVLEAAAQFPDTLDKNSEAEDLKDFLIKFRAQLRQVSEARLSDGRPFTHAAHVVKEWFTKTEKKMKAADQKLATVLSTYASAAEAKADEVRQRNAELEQTQKEGESGGKTIGETFSGEPIVTVNANHKADVPEVEKVPAVPDVPMVWQVKEFDIDSLDLEKLRHYLTERGITLAINAHIKIHGPHQIDGVIYQQVVKKKLDS